MSQRPPYVSMTTPDPAILAAVRNSDLDFIIDAIVKFLHQRSEEEQLKGDLDAPYEDPVVGITEILQVIGWPETQEMYVLLEVLKSLRIGQNVAQSVCLDGIDFYWV
jgi:hypothetical protein